MSVDDELILLVLGYLCRFEKDYSGNGYFILPCSEENIFVNLKRISRQSPFFVRTQLKAFLKRRRKDIEVKVLTEAFTYVPRDTYSGRIYTHTGSYHISDYELQDPERVLILHDSLIEEARNVYEAYGSSSKSYFRELLPRAGTVRDLLFLLWLRLMVEENLEGGLVQLEPDWDKRSEVLVAFESLEKLLRDLEVDKEVIETLFSIVSEIPNVLLREFAKSIDKMDQKSLVILRAHFFNSTSCLPLQCLYFHEAAATSLYDILIEAGLERHVQETYASLMSAAQHEHIDQASDLVKLWLSTEVKLATQEQTPKLSAGATREGVTAGSALQPQKASPPEKEVAPIVKTEKECLTRSRDEGAKEISIKELIFKDTCGKDASLDFDAPSHVLNIVLQNVTTSSAFVKIRFEMPSTDYDTQSPIIPLKVGEEKTYPILFANPKKAGPHEIVIPLTDEKDRLLECATSRIVIKRSFGRKLAQYAVEALKLGTALKP